MSESVKFTIVREHNLKRTQRTNFRISQAGINLGDLANPDKCFATMCHLLIALIDEPNVKMSAEDVAVAIEGRETEAIQAINKCFDVDSDLMEVEQKKPGSKGGLSSESKSD